MGSIYHQINRTDALTWPSAELRKVAGEDGWGDWKPKNGDVGAIVHTFRRDARDGGPIYLLRIDGHYVPIRYDAVKVKR